MCASSAGRPVAAQYRVRLSRPDRCGCSPVPSTNEPSRESTGAPGRGGVPEDADPPLGRPDQAHEHPQGRRLAGAVGAEQAEHLAAAHLEGQVADGDEAVLVGLGHALEAQRHVLAVGLDGRHPPAPTPAPQHRPRPSRAGRAPTSDAEQHPPAGGAGVGLRPARRPRAPRARRASPARPDGVDRRLGRQRERPGRWWRRRAASCGRPRSGARSPGSVTGDPRRPRRVGREAGQRQRRDQARRAGSCRRPGATS